MLPDRAHGLPDTWQTAPSGRPTNPRRLHAAVEPRPQPASWLSSSERLLAGTGTAQTQFDYDAEVDFGRQQIALTQKGGPLAADVAKLKLGDVLADIARTTEALAEGLGRASATKRRPPSRLLRDALAECAAAFNGVHGDLVWFLDNTPPGPDHDRLAALAAPLDALLSRHGAAEAAPSAPAEPEAPAAPEVKGNGS